MALRSDISTTARRIALVALALLAAAPLGARPGPPPSPTDSTDALTWARRVVAARQAVEAAEAEADPARQADLAAGAFREALDLASAAPDAALRDLVLRAQAIYEARHGGAQTLALTPAEFGALRADALAPLRGADAEIPLVDPARLAAERAERAAEAERAAGPAHLFYPASAVPLVEAQHGVARRFVGLRSRMRRHFPGIERTLRRRGLPEELKYVAVIESALNPEAESHAGARGIWQFMPETAADYGLDSLTVADPAASTDAAARYLRWLGRRFSGDFQLALAAYNCGVGRVEAIVRTYRAETGATPTFWDIVDALPRETQAYVPRFIAVAELLGG